MNVLVCALRTIDCAHTSTCRFILLLLRFVCQFCTHIRLFDCILPQGVLFFLFGYSLYESFPFSFHGLHQNLCSFQFLHGRRCLSIAFDAKNFRLRALQVLLGSTILLPRDSSNGGWHLKLSWRPSWRTRLFKLVESKERIGMMLPCHAHGRTSRDGGIVADYAIVFSNFHLMKRD